MDENEWLADRFEEHRPHLRAVAYRMLGSLTEADDAVQDTWIRVSRAGTSEVENLGGWMTTIVARVCLNMLRSRTTRREEAVGGARPRPRRPPRGGDPARRGGAAGRLGRPRPPRRARHDGAGRAAGVRAARHVRPALRGDRTDGRPHAGGGAPARQPGPPARARRGGPAARRRPRPPATVVDAFFRAAHGGDFEALVAVLDPDVVLRADVGARRRPPSRVVQGAEAVARRPSCSRSRTPSWSRPS